MLTENIYYAEEKVYASNRLIILIIATFFSLMIYQQTEGEMEVKTLYVSFSMIALTFVSLLHYFFIRRYPNTLQALRRSFILILDLLVLTLFIALFEEKGLFLFPLYIMIVMQSGFSLGINYFYTSVIVSGILWFLLFQYSGYWHQHSDIIATFAMTSLLVPLFYLKYINRVHEEKDELNEILSETAYDANYDTLTGIANRKMYKEYVKQSIKEREPFALLFIDLNKFKVINDTYGHDVGDKVLQEATRRLSNAIDEEDFIARLGGDEFVIITKRKHIFLKKFVEKLEKKVIRKHRVNGIVVPISLSIGISLYPDDSAEEMMLSKYADEAMYLAKKTPHRTHYFYRDIHTNKYTNVS